MSYIALTGAMGCGKSTATEAFAELGAIVYDADKLARELLESDIEVRQNVRRILGDCAFDSEGFPDKAGIARLVFADAKLLNEYEQAIYPKLFAKLERLRDADKTVVVEVPLLFEKSLESRFEICITVACSEQSRYRRLLARGMSPEQIAARNSCQMPSNRKVELADIVLFNEGSTVFLKRQAALILKRLKSTNGKSRIAEHGKETPRQKA